MTPAEEMTAAAALMRERAVKAAAAAPGPWSYGDEWVRSGDFCLADLYGPAFDAVGQHIAGMHPAVALAAAGWLDREAGSAAGTDACEGSDAYPLMLAGYALPLAVARAYLGTEGNRR